MASASIHSLTWTESTIWSSALAQVSNIASAILNCHGDSSSVISEERLREVAGAIYRLDCPRVPGTRSSALHAEDAIQPHSQFAFYLPNWTTSCGCVPATHCVGLVRADALNASQHKGLYWISEQYVAHSLHRVGPVVRLGRTTDRTRSSAITSRDSHDLSRVSSWPSGPRPGYCPLHCDISEGLVNPVFVLGSTASTGPIVPTRPVMADRAEVCQHPILVDDTDFLQRQRNLALARHRRYFGRITSQGSVGDMVFEHLNRLCSEHSLVRFYRELHSQYVFELYLWLYVRVCVDRKMLRVHRKLELISRILGRPVEAVLISSVTSFVQKVVVKQKQTVDSVLILLRQMEGGEVTPLLAARLRELAVSTNVQLDTKRLLRRFCREVGVLAGKMLLDYQNRIFAKLSR